MERRRRVRAQVVRTEDTVVTVTASGVGVDDNRRETLDVRKFEVEPAYVRVGAGITRNLGNYESLRVDVAITVPCYVEEIEAVQGRLGEQVAKLLDSEIESYLDDKV